MFRVGDVASELFNLLFAAVLGGADLLCPVGESGDELGLTAEDVATLDSSGRLVSPAGKGISRRLECKDGSK